MLGEFSQLTVRIFFMPRVYVGRRVIYLESKNCQDNNLSCESFNGYDDNLKFLANFCMISD